MASYVEKGFRAVKMKGGRLSPQEEEQRVRAAREAVGADIELMIDMNNGWRDLTQALQHVRRFEQYDPYFIEEPFSPMMSTITRALRKPPALRSRRARSAMAAGITSRCSTSARRRSCNPMRPCAGYHRMAQDRVDGCIVRRGDVSALVP